MTQDELVQSLSVYVSGDDFELDRFTFLLFVRDRIDADLDALQVNMPDEQ